MIAHFAGLLFACAAFLGMVWLVERARWAFWEAAIRNSGRCQFSGCLCPCHGLAEDNLSAKELDLLEGHGKQPTPL